MQDAVQLPSPCVVVLVGPGASGKSTWAATHFAPEVIVSSDRLRALVGSGEDDIAAKEAMCYPRPLQAHVPVIVGGGGERRTLRLAARYAATAK